MGLSGNKRMILKGKVRSTNKKIKVKLVTIGAWVYPETYRTRKSSACPLMVLGGRPPGRVRNCQLHFFLFNTPFKGTVRTVHGTGGTVNRGVLSDLKEARCLT